MKSELAVNIRFELGLLVPQLISNMSFECPLFLYSLKGSELSVCLGSDCNKKQLKIKYITLFGTFNALENSKYSVITAYCHEKTVGAKLNNPDSFCTTLYLLSYHQVIKLRVPLFDDLCLLLLHT